MSRLICKCGSVVVEYPGGIKVIPGDETGPDEIFCQSCGFAVLQFSGKLRFEAVSPDEVFEYIENTEEEHGVRFVCSCGCKHVRYDGKIIVKVLEDPAFEEVHETKCCLPECKEIAICVPPGYSFHIFAEFFLGKFP